MQTERNTIAKQHDRYTWQPDPTWRSLPGFVEAGVTYESHHFWIEWTHSKWETVARPTANIWVRHGGGVESIEVSCHHARALRELDDAGAFHLCWAVFQLAREAAQVSAALTRRSIFQAIADGRLKKRKIPKAHGLWIWITENGYAGRKHVLVPGDPA